MTVQFRASLRQEYFSFNFYMSTTADIPAGYQRRKVVLSLVGLKLAQIGAYYTCQFKGQPTNLYSVHTCLHR